jgi:hypothetical protein
LSCTLCTKQIVAIVEYVLDLIEEDERPAISEKILPGTKGTQTLFPVYGIAIFVFTGHLEEFTVHFPGQYPGKLTFPCPWYAMQEDVNAEAFCGKGLTQIWAEHSE